MGGSTVHASLSNTINASISKEVDLEVDIKINGLQHISIHTLCNTTAA